MIISTKKSTLRDAIQSKAVFSLLFAFFFLTSSSLIAGNKVIPGVPGQIIGQTNVCAYVGTSQVITYRINAVPGAELYLWTVPPTVQLISGQGTTSISVMFNAGFTAAANKQIKVRSISQEGNSADRILYLTSQQPSTPSAINGPSNACLYIGTPNQAVYTTARDAAATGYIWGADPTGTLITHPNGPGVNDTIIHVTFKNGYKTNPITVQAVNNCGFSAARILTVSGSAPNTPGVISGPTNACGYMLPNGAVATYSINPVAGASSYTWLTPANCIVNHPNGAGSSDVVITVQYPSDFTGGSIAVIASSGCDDSSPRTLNISKLNPSTPSAITGVQKTSCPDREYTYSLTAMPSNATSVAWTVPVDALSISGQGTSSITVSYPATRVVGLVTATGVSNCASSASRQLNVTYNRCQVERGTNSTGKGDISAAVTINKQQAAITEESLQVKIAPNPSRGSFKLQVLAKNQEPVNIKVLDLQGREIKKITTAQGQSVVFGNELRPGTYIVEINQGNQKLTEKILKL